MSNMMNLGDLLSGLVTEYGDNLEGASKGPSGAYDGPPLPENLEYRVICAAAKYKTSTAGNPMIDLALEVQEPVEFAGRRIHENLMVADPNTWAREKIARTISAFGVSLAGFTSGDDWDGFAAAFVDHGAVITVKAQASDVERRNVRYINPDRGQSLRTNIAPKSGGGSGAAKSLIPEIQIQKQEEPFPAQPYEPTAPTQATLPGTGVGTGTYTGPKLPPGLAG